VIDENEIGEQDVAWLHARLDGEAEAAGYHLNPDATFTRDLVRGLVVNERRYGYRACPCRLASGEKVEDLDIICPCDYRDADIAEHGACYCALYVSEAVAKGEREATSIPERRPAEEDRRKAAGGAGPGAQSRDLPEPERAGRVAFAVPVWRCKVCGYRCARDGPPEVCPICKAKKDRFERFA